MTTTPRNKIIPCPCCGGKRSRIREYDNDNWRQCNRCDWIVAGASVGEIGAAWNRRSDESRDPNSAACPHCGSDQVPLVVRGINGEWGRVCRCGAGTLCAYGSAAEADLAYLRMVGNAWKRRGVAVPQ